MPKYYKDSITVWREIKYENNAHIDGLSEQLIWYNRNILVKKKTVYSKRLYLCGMISVTDLYVNNQIVPFNIWIEKGVKHKDYMLWRSILSAIPKRWVGLLKSNNKLYDNMEVYPKSSFK